MTDADIGSEHRRLDRAIDRVQRSSKPFTTNDTEALAPMKKQRLALRDEMIRRGMPVEQPPATDNVLPLRVVASRQVATAA